MRQTYTEYMRPMLSENRVLRKLGQVGMIVFCIASFFGLSYFHQEVIPDEWWDLWWFFPTFVTEIVLWCTILFYTIVAGVSWHAFIEIPPWRKGLWRAGGPIVMLGMMFLTARIKSITTGEWYSGPTLVVGIVSLAFVFVWWASNLGDD